MKNINNARRGLPDKTKVDFSERTIIVHVEESRSMMKNTISWFTKKEGCSGLHKVGASYECGGCRTSCFITKLIITKLITLDIINTYVIS